MKNEDVFRESGSPSVASDNSISTTDSDEDAEAEDEVDMIDDEDDEVPTFREGEVFEEEDAEGEVDDDEEDMSLTRPIDGVIRSSQAPSSPPHPIQDDYDISSSRASSSSTFPTQPMKVVNRVGPPIGVKPKRGSGSKGSPTTLAERLSTPKTSPDHPVSSPQPSLAPSRRLSTPLRGTVLSPRNQDPVNDHDRAVVRAELTKLMTHLRTLEASNARLTSEAARLRPRAEGAEVLREKVRDLERKVEGVEGLRNRTAELEKLLEEARTALALERESGHGSPADVGMDIDTNLNAHPSTTPAAGEGTPISVTMQLSALRTTHARLLDEHGQVVATLKARGMELAELQLEVDQLRSDIARLKSEGALLANEKRNAERSCGTKDQEIEFLKSLIVSHSLLFRT